MKTVILCEKPDMAINIAKALGSFDRKGGYLETHEYYITWAYGHLFNLAPPQSYIEENRIKIEDLPIIPGEFKLVVIKEKNAQYLAIRNLFLKAESIINATDAGREGELIFRYIYNKTNCGKPVKRLWLKSLTKKGILKGFNNLQKGSLYNLLYLSAKARAEADWLIGLNASLAFSYKANLGRSLSLGRVQTPTLKIIVDRFSEVRTFIKAPIYSPYISIETTKVKRAKLLLQYCKPLYKKPDNDFFEKISGKVVCVDKEEKKQIEKAPLPFDLPSLQQKANQIFKYSAKKTTILMQSLYEKHKVLSYPRTDSRFITKDIYEEIPGVLKELKNYSEVFSKYNEMLSDSKLPENCVNDSNVTDHHAIIPTGVITHNLSQEEKNIYEIVVKQFYASFFPPCVKKITNFIFSRHSEVSKESNDYFFIKGVVIKNKGWRTVLNDNMKDVIIPEFKVLSSYQILDKGIKKSFTKPKSYFTDGTLIAAMTGAGKEFDNNYDIPKDVKLNGIGRQGTRDQIIETLLYRNYIVRDNNFLVPTNFGLEVIQSLEGNLLTSVNLTGEWENSLERIVQGSLDYTEFKTSINTLTKNITEQISKITTSFSEEKYNCPSCKKKNLVNRQLFFTCLSDSCEFKLWKKQANKIIDDKELINLLSKGKTNLIKGFIYEKDNVKRNFNAVLILRGAKIEFDYSSQKLLKDKYLCPKCKEGHLKENNKTVFCENYEKGCNFSIWKEIFKKKISSDNMILLIKGKVTTLIKGFISKNNKKFNAKLIVDECFLVKPIFK
ncbi:type IA DNA topoisomerase [Tenacibaculum ovolyticum]|uniref:type IA DNA topoisomerase n=1 Tax=Tenacibaculum ovolyticum TaxID=104270 RepID=UPI0007EC6E73|nr:type IA DNA topoisomerase [Tenacibaculum ovolyticum]